MMWSTGGIRTVSSSFSILTMASASGTLPDSRPSDHTGMMDSKTAIGIPFFGMVHLSFEKGEGYLRFFQADSREEIGCAQVFEVDACPLDGIGTLIATSALDIEVLHQGDTSEEILSSRQPKSHSDPAEGFQAGVDALQGICRFGCRLAHSQLEQGVDAWAVLVDETLQTLSQTLDTGCLQNQVWVLQL